MLQSVASPKAGYEEHIVTFTNFGTMILPSDIKFKGSQSTENKGHRFALAYSFFLTENFSIRLGYAKTESTYTIKDSTLKGQLNLLSLLTGSGSTNLIASMLPAFGPYPSNKDSRTDLSLEFVYNY